jgi:DNA-binding MarR family transcriptional regulator
VTDDADFVDSLMASWAESRPDLDVTPVAVATRLSRIRDHLEGEMAAVFGAHGLTAPTFVMLVTLTRLLGTGDAVTEARIAAELGLTPDTVGMRMERLATDGLVRRQEARLDLTDQGRALMDAVVPAHLDRLAHLLSALTGDEQVVLAGLLRKLLVALEGPTLG